MPEYEKDYHQDRHRRLIEDEAFFRINAAVADAKFWDKLDGRVVEVGCGVGRNLGNHPDAFGTDVSHYALEVARSHGLSRLSLMDAEKLAFEDSSFDGILCAHVLEHLERPIEVLREFSRVLAPGGSLVLALPLKRYPSTDMDQHLHVWGEKEISNLLNRVGFDVVSVRVVSYRIKKMLCRVLPPKPWVVALSRLAGTLGLFLRSKRGPNEMIVHATTRQSSSPNSD